MRVAIFGGTFDPVHSGHIEMAEYTASHFDTDSVIFVPNGNPPHKRNKTITDYKHRYNMLELALDGTGFELSDYESGDKYSYSVDTMRHFRALYGDAPMIIGADSLLSIHTWHKWNELAAENEFIVFKRDETDFAVREYLRNHADAFRSVHLADMPEVDISSTKIRNELKQGYIDRNLICDNVAKYIADNALYGGIYNDDN